MKREAHVLKPNHSNKLPINIVCIDTETSQEYIEDKEYKIGWEIRKDSFKCGWARYFKREGLEFIADKWLFFTNPKEFWIWLNDMIKDKQRFYLFAHNWNYDFNILDSFNNLDAMGYELTKSWVMDTQRVILSFENTNNNNRKVIKFVDSGNYVKAPLEEIGKAVGIPKMDKPNFQTATIEELKPYCKNDVLILSEFIKQIIIFLKQHDLGCFKPTSAGLCFNAFRHKFMKHQIFIHDNEKALALERDSYRGGRTEAFYIGNVDKPLIKLDVNSQYPFVMRNNKYPTKIIGYVDNGTLEELKDYIARGFLVCARVTFSCDTNAIAVKHNGKLIFPTAKHLTQSLVTPEIEYLLEHGKIEDVFEIAIYEGDYIFKEYVDYFYALKVAYKLNKVFYTMVKLFLNGLYGKFGQKQRENIIVGEDKELNKAVAFIERYVLYTEENIETYTRIGKITYLLGLTELEAKDSSPIISSHVTANARLYIHRLKEIANSNGNNVYYIDTDSLFALEQSLEPLNKFINETELGLLKNEGIIKDVSIFGAKDYRYSYLDNGKEKIEQKIKGIRLHDKDTKQISPNIYEQTQYNKILSMAREGISDKVIVERRIKHLDRTYKKGIVTSSGWVKPLSTIKEIEKATA